VSTLIPGGGIGYPIPPQSELMPVYVTGLVDNAGVTDNTNAIIDAAGEGNVTLYLPPSQHGYGVDLSATGTLLPANVTLMGQGSGATLLCGVVAKAGAQTAVMDSANGAIITTRVTIDGGGYGAKAWSCDYAWFNNGGLNNAIENDVYLQGGSYVSLYDLKGAQTTRSTFYDVYVNNSAGPVNRQLSSLATTANQYNVTVNGTTDVFTPADVGRGLASPVLLPGSYILEYVSPTTVTLDQKAPATTAGQVASVTQGDDCWFAGGDVQAALMRPGGGVKRFMASGQFTVCHWLLAPQSTSNGLSNCIFDASVEMDVCEFDSCPQSGTSGTGGMIVHKVGGGVSTLSNCSFYQNVSTHNPMIIENDVASGTSGSGIIVQGGSLTAKAAAAGAMSSLIKLAGGANLTTQIDGLYVDGTNALEETNGQPTIYEPTSVSTQSGPVNFIYGGTNAALAAPVLDPLPAAAANTFGASVSTALATETNGYTLNAISWTPLGVSAETITMQFTATFSDGSTQSTTPAAVAGNSTVQNLSANALINLFKTGVAIVAVSVETKSSIANSTATPAVNLALSPLY
jgi:hypothetical protein